VLNLILNTGSFVLFIWHRIIPDLRSGLMLPGANVNCFDAVPEEHCASKSRSAEYHRGDQVPNTLSRDVDVERHRGGERHQSYLGRHRHELLQTRTVVV